MFRANPNIQIASMIHENEAFVRGFLQIPKVKDVKTKLSCEASFEFQEVKKWPHLFSAAVPMHRVSQHMQNTIAQHHQRREKVTWNHQLHCARSSGTFYGKATTPETVARASQRFSATEPWFSLPEKTQCFVQILTFKSHPWFMKTKLSCEASFKFQKWKTWKRSFRARLPSNSKSWLEDLLSHVLTRF